MLLSIVSYFSIIVYYIISLQRYHLLHHNTSVLSSIAPSYIGSAIIYCIIGLQCYWQRSCYRIIGGWLIKAITYCISTFPTELQVVTCVVSCYSVSLLTWRPAQWVYQGHPMEPFGKIAILRTLLPVWQNLSNRSWIYLNVALICKFLNIFSNIFVAIAIIMHSASQIGEQQQNTREFQIMSLVPHPQGHFMKKSGQLAGKYRTCIWTFKMFIINNKDTNLWCF